MFAAGFIVNGGLPPGTHKEVRVLLSHSHVFDEMISFQVLPIFPLRTSLKFPTENLTLNLFEDRYLAIAEYVLKDQNESRFFGAVHAGFRPQIVRGGVGPIVPLICKGDVGVCFLVDSFEDSLIPTIGSSYRRRIRLLSRGIQRFRINRILDNGFGLVKGKEDASSLPFILAEVEMFSDRLSIESESEFDRLALSVTCSSLNDELIRVQDAQRYLSEKNRSIRRSATCRESLSFAVASKFVAEGNYDRRFHLLHLQDSLQRLREVCH